MLDTNDIDGMRREAEASLPDTATVARATTVSDGAGGRTETWATVATTRCRVAPGGNLPAERIVADRVKSTVVWSVTLPATVDVRATDRVLVGTRTFEVIGVLAPRSFGVLARVVAVEV